MATYAIGDIQGCFKTLKALLRTLAFDASRDTLWLAGDLVNRGPRSLEVLRWASSLPERHTAVLGNHDFHAICRFAGISRPGKRDTLDALLEASDAAELVRWLRHCPLLHRCDDTLMVHAGLLPDWSADEALAIARDLEARLVADDWRHQLAIMHDTRLPVSWSAAADDRERRILALQSLLRLRVCSTGGCPNFAFKGSPAGIGEGFLPWFAIPGRKSRDHRIVFGHWARLGLRNEQGVTCLDTGCVYGRHLTALDIDNGRIIQELNCE